MTQWEKTCIPGRRLLFQPAKPPPLSDKRGGSVTNEVHGSISILLAQKPPLVSSSDSIV